MLNIVDAEVVEPFSCCVTFSCLARVNPESVTKTKPKMGKKTNAISSRVLNLIIRLASFEWRNAN
jgi:hypothetical protein